MAIETAKHIDLTLARARTVRDFDAEFALIGTPVYGGRVPFQAAQALRMVKAAGTPAVLVVVYGNRAYEDALLELKGIVEEAGFRPFAGAAFVGEHSFSTDAIPIAAGRPDNEDLEKARSFGSLVREILERKPHLHQTRSFEVPGNFPYRDRASLGVSPESREDLCVRCRKCEEVCPEEVVRVGEGGVSTDGGKCILCCACVKICPTGARRVTDPRASQLIQKLALLCRDRKEPEFFFPVQD